MLLAREIARPFISTLPNTAKLVESTKLSIRIHQEPVNLDQALYEYKVGKALPPISFIVDDVSGARPIPIMMLVWKPKCGFIAKHLEENWNSMAFDLNDDVVSRDSISNQGSLMSNPFALKYGSTTASTSSSNSDSVCTSMIFPENCVMRLAFAEKSLDVLVKIQHPSGVTMYKVHETSATEFDIRRAGNNNPGAKPHMQIKREPNWCLSCLLCCGCTHDQSDTFIYSGERRLARISPSFRLWSSREHRTRVEFLSPLMDGEQRAISLASAFMMHLSTAHCHLLALLTQTSS